MGCRNEGATPWTQLCPSAKSLCCQHVAGRSPAPLRCLPPPQESVGIFHPSFLCLSAATSVTFLVSPYRDLSTQRIVLFLVSRFVVCHLSVLALAPFSPGYAPESLVSWQGLLLVSCCAGIYHPAWCVRQTESQLDLLPWIIRGDPRSSAGVWSHLWNGQWGRGAGGDVSMPQLWSKHGPSIYSLWDLSCRGFCPHSQIKNPRVFVSLCCSHSSAGVSRGYSPAPACPLAFALLPVFAEF